MLRPLLLGLSHLAALAIGAALGIYLLPILTAPPAPTEAQLLSQTGPVLYTARFERELKDSDALHWGEGAVTVTATTVSVLGRLAPGPDYKLYLSPEFVETEADFMRLKATMVRVGDVRTFDNFFVPLPTTIEPANYRAVIVWCESFSQFITAANYR